LCDGTENCQCVCVSAPAQKADLSLVARGQFSPPFSSSLITTVLGGPSQPQVNLAFPLVRFVLGYHLITSGFEILPSH
jgi:hypothetical protein